MRRLVACILMLGLVLSVVGCGSVKYNVSDPKAGQWAWKNNRILWESWDKKTEPLPLVLTLNTHSTYIAKITDIPLYQGLTVYARIDTFGSSSFTEAGQVPIEISAQDLQDVQRGNVVRIVVVDPKKEYQTSRFVQLRLSPTEDALKRGKEIGKPLVLVTLGNREPKFMDWGTFGKSAQPY
jgi:hypothetical protein